MNHNHQRKTYPACKGVPVSRLRNKRRRGTPSKFEIEYEKELTRVYTPAQRKLIKKFHTRKSRRYLNKDVQANFTSPFEI